MTSRRVNTSNIKIPKKIKSLLDSCKQKPFGSDVGFPSSITVKGSECGRGSERLYAVQFGGRGSGPTGLDLIIHSAANFRNKMSLDVASCSISAQANR